MQNMLFLNICFAKQAHAAARLATFSENKLPFFAWHYLPCASEAVGLS